MAPQLSQLGASVWKPANCSLRDVWTSGSSCIRAPARSSSRVSMSRVLPFDGWWPLVPFLSAGALVAGLAFSAAGVDLLVEALVPELKPEGLALAGSSA